MSVVSCLEALSPTLKFYSIHLIHLAENGISTSFHDDGAFVCVIYLNKVVDPLYPLYSTVDREP